MTVVLVTGASGFIGKNLMVALQARGGLQIHAFDADDRSSALERGLAEADIIYHLAGVNRPERPEEYETGNAGLTQAIADSLESLHRCPIIVFSSSIQAALNNPYGISKRRAEEALLAFAERSGATLFIYRLPNIFGKWSRPHYNSVVATYCHNIARGIEITISDPEHELELAYVDDVVASFLEALPCGAGQAPSGYRTVVPVYHVRLGQLAEAVHRLREVRSSLHMPDLDDRFMRCLYATYLSYLDQTDFGYPLAQKTDARGTLAELLKSPHFGQIFVSRTVPGVTRGNHYHDRKIEKFCVLEGKAVIRFRHMASGDLLTYTVDGLDFKVVDIPPGYSHSLENVGDSDLVVLFWSSEVFDVDSPDTYPSQVLR